ncbi:restriction endonuclease [Caloranaerobacter azorensis]|uniref:Restriction endonuclease n=3 Tax=Caloranaerobacter azorensis TaxID=116090 RepID=A0A1M5VV79_9FIRM|nr:restriction endonuclease [Caloranaerobacter azorensis]KGG80445.1 hypothetical protein Y919_06070 [Caloranaerobacter azorensis H53214]QIB26729.1 restriction endonuclease [Caloranaerobacter azorensis]SHH79156.1 Restriction endonuclease [Caloranaerobacter azorensis DSM 13643]
MDITNALKITKKRIDNYKNKKRLKKYYLEEMNKGKSYVAIILDGIMLRLIIAFGFFLYFYVKTDDYLFSFAVSVQFFIILNLLLYQINTIKFNRVIKKTNEIVAKEEILKDLLNKTPYEFIEYCYNVLDNIGLEDLKMLHQRDIDMIGNFKGKSIGIKCLQYEDDYKVTIKDVKEFFLSLKKMDIESGAIITTSTFTEDTKDFLPKLQDHIRIYLFDKDSFVELIKKTELYPKEREIEKVIINRMRDRNKKIREYRKNLLSKGKSSKYIFLSAIIYFFGKFTNYQKYYSIASYFLLILGLASIIKNIVIFLKPEVEKNEDSFI